MHNSNNLRNIFDLHKVSVGNYSYGDLNIMHYGGYEYNLQIGSFVSIGSDVRFLVSSVHPLDTFMTIQTRWT